MINFIYQIKETFYSYKWEKKIKKYLLEFQIHNNYIINDIINILIGIICSLEMILIQSFWWKIIIIIITLIVCNILLHIVDSIIVYYYYPYKIKKRTNNIKLLYKYLNKLKKEQKFINDKTGRYSNMLYYMELQEIEISIKKEINKINRLIEFNKQKEEHENAKKEIHNTYNKIDKKNILYIQNILILLKQQQHPNQFDIQINNIIQLSENIFIEISDNPNLIKIVMKTFNIYLNELTLILENINSLDKQEQEQYYETLSIIIKKITKHLYKIIEDINCYKKDEISLSLKVLDEELSLEKNINIHE